MLLPDLAKLALCPTGGNNDAEAGPSQPSAGPNQNYALGQADILRSILLSLAKGDPEEACRAAAHWCNLNKDHQRACEDGGYALLIATVFPGKPPKPPGLTHEEWFYHLCHQNRVEKHDAAKAEHDELRSAALANRTTDPATRNLFQSLRNEKFLLAQANRMVQLMKNDKEKYDAFLARREARDATHPEEKEITDLMARAHAVLNRTLTPEYRNTPLYQQYMPYINRIQGFRMRIFIRRYLGRTLDTDGEKFRALAKALKESLDQLERVMEHSKEQKEAADRLQQL
jgi:hypothetical protein